MLSTNLFLVFLLILPCGIIADDSSSFKPQDLTYPPIASSDADADASQPVTDLELSPEVLLAESENNVANCQGPPPGGSTRRSRIRKRQNNFCSWQPFKSGAPTTTPPQTAPQNDVSGTEKGPADVQKPEGDKAPIVNPFGGAKTPEICGPEKETIPVCHYSPERLGSNRWLSPTPVLTPVRLYGPGQVCMGLEETWCCSSTSPRPNDRLDINYPNMAMLYPLAGDQCAFVTGPVLGRDTTGFPSSWR